MLNKFLFFLFLLTSLAYGQDITLYGTVTDTEGDVVPKARFYFASNPKKVYRTDVEGNYSIQYQRGVYDSIYFDHVGFDRAVFVSNKRIEKRAKKDSINRNIVLPDRLLKPFVLTANGPKLVFGTQEYSVSDFEFQKNGNLLLLTYEKTLQKGSVLRLLDSNQVVIDSYYVPGEAIELKTDFRDETHLIMEEKVYWIRAEKGRIRLFLEDRDYYFKYVAPVIDTIGERIYFSNYSDLYPAFDYFEFDRSDSSYNKMLKVENADMMELYRAEFKYVDVRTKIWAHDKQLETGIDKEIWVGATVFTNSLYYEPLYAPLFKKGEDSVLVFDHYKNYLFKYTPESGFTDSIRISYHKDERKSGWEQPLIQDSETGIVYGVFLRNGYTYLSEISSVDGQVVKSFKVRYKYVENIQIKDGHVYYIYRPLESVQKKYIYKEELRY